MKRDGLRGGLLRYLGLLAVPGIPCFCWYALGGAGSGFRALELIAYPLALLGVGGVVMALLGRRDKDVGGRDP